MDVGELVQVGVGVGELVQVGVGVGEYCPAVGWVWAKLAGGEVGEADLVGCASAVAEILGRGDGPVVPRRGPPDEFRPLDIVSRNMAVREVTAAAYRRGFINGTPLLGAACRPERCC